MAKKTHDEIPYPPPPENVPDDLTDFPADYVTREWVLLICCFTFLLLYCSLVLFFGFLTAWCLLNIATYKIGGIVGGVFSLLGFAILLKGFFKSSDSYQKELLIELEEHDHPALFEFIDRVCEETGAERPNQIFVEADVNASVRMQISIANLFVQPKKNLVLGLGLINCLNLSEFKAVLAHEFGHFNQGGFVGAYANVVNRIIIDIVNGRDWFDDMIDGLRAIGGLGELLALILGGMMSVVRSILVGVFHVLGSQRFKMAREQEFHADLVAASSAGSDAIVHGLFKTKHGAEFLGFAFGELRKCADHKMYTADLYFHQHAAGEIVRKKKKEPKLGIPPVLDGPKAGKKIQVFDPDTEEDPADEGDYHPSNYDREENVKDRFIAAEMDMRSPWLLFNDPGDLRERMTYKFYRMYGKVPKGTELTDPREVQQFIDEEHAETTYDAKYGGAYDSRIIRPGDLDELNDSIAKEPWADDRLKVVYSKLYGEIGDRAESRAELVKQYDALLEKSGPNKGRKVKKLLKDLESKLDQSDEWFQSLDRRVYLVFVQMAYRVHNDYYYELINRYQFQLAIQAMYKSARHHQAQAIITLNLISSNDQVTQDDFLELMHVLREARAALKKILREAKELDMPAMKHFEEGKGLADFLLDEDLIKELPESYVKGKWIDKMMRQLEQVLNKSARLHGKGLGGILRLQEEIAAKYLAAH